MKKSWFARKKFVLLYLSFLIFVLPVMALTIAAYFKRGSVIVGWQDFLQQLSGINDFSDLVITGPSPCQKDGEKTLSKQLTDVTLKNAAGSFYTLAELKSEITASLVIDCEQELEPKVDLGIFFTVVAPDFTSKIEYTVELFSESNEKLMQRTVNGIYGYYSYNPSDQIPVSLYISKGRPIQAVPHKIIITQDSTDSRSLKSSLHYQEAIHSRYKNKPAFLDSDISFLNKIKDAKIQMVERISYKGFWESSRSESTSYFSSYSGSSGSRRHLIIYTDLKLENFNQHSIQELGLEIEFLDSSGNIVDTQQTHSLWQDKHGLTIKPGSYFGFARGWIIRDYKSFERIADYRARIHTLRLE